MAGHSVVAVEVGLANAAASARSEAILSLELPRQGANGCFRRRAEVKHALYTVRRGC